MAAGARWPRTPPDLAPIRAQVYKDPRPKEYFDHFHERSRTREPDWVYEVVRIVTSLYAWTFFRARASRRREGAGRGPVILAPNHFSFMDHFFAGVVRSGAASASWPSRSCSRRRCSGSTATAACSPCGAATRTTRRSSPRTGSSRRGGAIVMYCEGGRSRTGELSEKPKRGIGRLALESGAPVVPVAIHGSSQVRNWKRLQFPKVARAATATRSAGTRSRSRRATSSRRSRTRSSRASRCSTRRSRTWRCSGRGS